MAEWTCIEGGEIKDIPNVFEDFGITELLDAIENSGMTYKTKHFDWDKVLGIKVSNTKNDVAVLVVYDSIGEKLVKEHNQGVNPLMIPLTEQEIEKVITKLEQKLSQCKP